MKKVITKSVVLFTLMAAFAIIFVGCSKDSSSSNSGGGPTPPQPGTYGTFTYGETSCSIAYGGYDCYYDEDDEEYVFTIGFADSESENSNAFAIAFIDRQTIPTGTFSYTTENPSSNAPEGYLITSDQHVYYCNSGSVTITKNGTSYTVTSQATVCDFFGQNTVNFTLSYTGPLPEFEDEE